MDQKRSELERQIAADPQNEEAKVSLGRFNARIDAERETIEELLTFYLRRMIQGSEYKEISPNCSIPQKINCPFCCDESFEKIKKHRENCIVLRVESVLGKNLSNFPGCDQEKTLRVSTSELKNWLRDIMRIIVKKKYNDYSVMILCSDGKIDGCYWCYYHQSGPDYSRGDHKKDCYIGKLIKLFNITKLNKYGDLIIED